MMDYERPLAELITFDADILNSGIAASQVCNCQAIQWKNNQSFLEECEMTLKAYVELGDHYD